MSEQPYEIELVDFDRDSRYQCEYFLAAYATLTGLSRAEIWTKLTPKMRKADSWRGGMFIEAARLLGFNVNERFRKFDPATPWPCILRLRVPKSWGWKGWWALIYNQEEVFNFCSEDNDARVNGWRILPLAEFEKKFPQVRITSMLQVWMSENISLTQADF